MVLLHPSVLLNMYLLLLDTVVSLLSNFPCFRLKESNERLKNDIAELKKDLKEYAIV